MKSFLWPQFSYGITKLFYVLLRLLATIVMLLHQWILSVFLFFFSKTNCRTSYPQGRRRRTNMPSTTMNRISEFFFPFVHHPISTRHFDSCQLVPGGFYPPNPLRKLWCWEKYGGRKDYTFSQSFEEDTVFENYTKKSQ